MPQFLYNTLMVETMAGQGDNYAATMLQMMQEEQREASQEHKEAVKAQRAARSKLSQAQSESRECDEAVTAAYQKMETAKAATMNAIQLLANRT